MIQTPGNLIEMLEFMLAELNEGSCRYTLIPAPEPRHIGHKIRVRENANPGWYRDLCRGYPDTRRTRTSTIIKRQYIKKILNELIIGQSNSKYAEDLIDIAVDYDENMRQLIFNRKL